MNDSITRLLSLTPGNPLSVDEAKYQLCRGNFRMNGQRSSADDRSTEHIDVSQLFEEIYCIMKETTMRWNTTCFIPVCTKYTFIFN
jgi:hypothetical protein